MRNQSEKHLNIKNNYNLQNISFLSLIYFKMALCILISIFQTKGIGTIHIIFFSCVFSFILFPNLLATKLLNPSFISKYFFILLFLLYILIRSTNFNNYNFIIIFIIFITYFYFIYSLERSYDDVNFYNFMKDKILIIYKVTIIIGIIQLVYFFIKNGLSIRYLMEVRPVKGFFIHPNIHAIITFLIGIYFFLNKKYVWSMLSFLSYLGTGTKTCVVMSFCCIIIFYRIYRNKKILPKHILISLFFMIMIIIILILKSLRTGTYRSIMENSNRIALNSFIWRLEAWKELISSILKDPIGFLIGKGMSSADKRVFEIFNRQLDVFYMKWPFIAPHSDYIKFFYDTGIIGLVIYILAITTIIKLAYKAKRYDILILHLIFVGIRLTESTVLYDAYIFHFALFGLEIGNALRIQNEKKLKNENDVYPKQLKIPQNT